MQENRSGRKEDLCAAKDDLDAEAKYDRERVCGVTSKFCIQAVRETTVEK